MLEIRNFTQNEIDEKLFQKIARTTLKILKVKNKTEISLAIVGSGRMKKLNKIYRKKNRVTDVLSFGDKNILKYLAKDFPRIKRKEDMEFVEPPDGVKRLGEIIVCYPQAEKQAKRAGHSLEKELAILLIHGILHLVGYEHERDKRRKKKMEEMEKEILFVINNN